ncbi:sensor histidine kinase [Clostridium perfringens]|uniref:sensor histidine kinase n=1 Tax=Clostridium perfringens TaxID=1502 RepID=UPI00232CADB9|nr:histidine kinase [Clostridium perfringens]MDB2043477.1 histidine kinase [Clostridium perfringens]
MIEKLIKWFLGKASIRKKLIISFSISVSIPIIVLGVYSFSESRKNLLIQTEKTMENNSFRIADEIDFKLKKEEGYAKYLAYNLNFRKVIENKPNDNISIAQTLNDTVEPIFWYFITSDDYIKEINIYTPNVSGEIGSFLKSSNFVEGEEWYKKSEKSFKPFCSYEDGKLFITRSILDTATNSKVIGVLRIELFMSIITEPLENMDFLDNGIIIKDNSGNIVFKKLMKNSKINELVLENILNIIDASNWKVFYYLDKKKITEELIPIIGSTLLIVIFCLIAVVILINILSKALSRRILLLKDKAEDVSKGNFNNPIFTEDTDEIGIVTNSFGHMTRDLNHMINKVYKIELEKKATELKALQAMINPHFLYNSLSTIKWKAIREGNDDISDITGYLAKFYRTSLNNGQDITDVKGEIDNIKSYIEIQKIAHSYSFDVEYRIDEKGLKNNMLNFILQPIVENAIKHGIDCNEGKERGKIIVEFQEDEGSLIFKIYNSSSNNNDINSIEEMLNKPGKGYGIYNVKERIELYYGIECNLECSLVENNYICIALRLPKINNKLN